MNHLIPKVRSAEPGTATTASPNQPALVRIRGPIMHLTGPNAFKTDSGHHPSNDLPTPVSAVAQLIEPSRGTEKAITSQKKPRKKRSKPQGPEYQPPPLNELKWLTIAQAAIRYPNYTEKALRHLVAQAEAYAKHPKAGLRSNGFLPCIVRPGGQRKVLLIAEAFETWQSSSQVGGQS